MTSGFSSPLFCSFLSLSCWGWPLNNVHDIEPQHPNKWFTGVWHCPMPETSFWVAAGMFGSKGHLAILFSWFLSEGYPLNLWVLGVGPCSLGLVSAFARCHFDSLWRCFKIWKELQEYFTRLFLISVIRRGPTWDCTGTTSVSQIASRRSV